MGQGEERSSTAESAIASTEGRRVENLAHATARAVAGISTLSRAISAEKPPLWRPAAEVAYNDVANFLELANNWFDKFDAELPANVEDVEQPEDG